MRVINGVLGAIQKPHLYIRCGFCIAPVSQGKQIIYQILQIDTLT
jgi:hypothetical protein